MEQVQFSTIGPESKIDKNSQVPTPITTEHDPTLPIGQIRESVLPIKFWNCQNPHYSLVGLQRQESAAIHNKSIQKIKIQEAEELEKELQLRQPPITLIEILFEIFSIVILTYNWVYFIRQYSNTPTTVSLNNSTEGTYSSIDKNFLILIIAGGSIQYCLLSVLQLIPHKFKYLVDITKENNALIFLTTRRFILFIKFVTLCLILYTTIAVFKVIKREWDSSLMYLMVITFVPYTIGGWLFYKRLITVSINPYA